MDHRAVDAGRVHVGQRLLPAIGLGPVRRQGEAGGPEVNLGIDDQHGIPPRAPVSAGAVAAAAPRL